MLNETNKTGSKKNINRNGTNGNSNRSKYELDSQGLVPLPAATCFYCRKSCKKAPLISCDYCPLFFHQVNQIRQMHLMVTQIVSVTKNLIASFDC